MMPAGSNSPAPAHVAGDAPGKTGVEADRVMVGVPGVLEVGAVVLVVGPPAWAATAGKRRPMCAATASGFGATPGGTMVRTATSSASAVRSSIVSSAAKTDQAGQPPRRPSSNTTLRCATAKPKPRSGTGAAARCGGIWGGALRCIGAYWRSAMAS